jgi:hypothetical protein
MPREVNKGFASQLVDLRGGGSDPLGPLGYFGLPLVNQASHHYHQIGLIFNHLTILNM